MKITFLVDNKTESTLCNAEWGLSVLIETGSKIILMDQGASPMLVENAEKMGIDISRVDIATVSHGHFDHTGGTTAFFDVNKKANVYIHKDALNRFFVPGEVGNVGVPWGQDFIRKNSDRIVFTEGVYSVDRDIWLIGNVPRTEGFSPTETFYLEIDDEILPDPMKHEQTLVIEDGGKLHVFSGCSHQGIVPILIYIGGLFPWKKISTVVGGMHLYAADKELRSKVIDEIEALGVERVFPVHCTGMKAIVDFKLRMGDKVKVAAAGESYEF